MKNTCTKKLTDAEKVNNFIKNKSLAGEQWKKLKLDGYSYYISSEGRVLNMRGKIVSVNPSSNGYRHVAKTTVHRAVAYAFGLIDDIKFTGENEIDHINSVKCDCRLINLQVMTHKENIEKRDSLGNARRRTIDCYDYKTNKYIKSYPSIKAAALDLNLQPSNICFTLRGQNKQTGGYTFIYSDTKEKYEYVGHNRMIKRPLIDCYKNGELFKTYHTIMEAAAELGIRRQSISYVLHDRQKTSYKIYTFKYRKQ